jgi:hypothetical protein
VPSHRIAAMSTRTERSKRHSRKSPTVRKPCSSARRCIRGATRSPRKRHPIAAEPDHHQADSPWRYPSPVAPTVEPAPMFAARRVTNTIPAGSMRPATKKSPEARTRRLTHSPAPTRRPA